ncbi:antitoxin ParD1/3/4 [Novosphingobium chloroacetimidivorans]|uniref:Antitoxin ParD1/3/4 n=1 Tax=Novosphingobium chloroacetimidivorans TaxID=1428314 RepID=A0A7W7K6V3_9SPHN|nr:type II toxin-antitoxin system ParD family antitoxin [Novosphingobium chloroacetimidivorans]MBB4857342.1 antitoxin ParD1/3/4 [Novosphingobium chloroacetimidivorans]
MTAYTKVVTELSFTMPPELQRWLEVRLAQGRYADAGDYLRDLVRRDQDAGKEDVAWVRAMVEEGLASGVIEAEPEDVLKEIMARLPDA